MARSDNKFFTNEPGSTLLDRFRQTLKDVRFFDALVGYFQTSGFHQLYKDLEPVEKIRILVGLGIDKQTFEILGLQKSPDCYHHLHPGLSRIAYPPVHFHR
jgi:hypothetical protein